MPTTTRSINVRCDRCGHTHSVESESEILLGPGGNGRYCRACFDRHFAYCEECGTLDYRSGSRRFAREGVEVQLCGECYQRQTTWDAGIFDSDNVTLRETKHHRRFGVELETAVCEGYRALRGVTLFGAKFDCSVSGMEFTSPILAGDEGLQAVRDFCALAADYTVDSSCGYHLHIDMRGESNETLKSVAYAYLKSDRLWRLLIESHRAEHNCYCERPNWTRGQLEHASDMANFCGHQSRYTLCNLQAYTKFGTYEIRLHHGSLNPIEICNWVKAHLRFVEWAKDKTFDEIDDAFRGSDANKWESLKSILGDISLNRYYGRKRRERLGIPARSARVPA